MTDSTASPTDAFPTTASPATGPEPTPTVIELDSPPDLTPMLARVAAGALPLPGRGGGKADRTLPDTTVVLHDATVDLDHLASYAEVCGFRLASTLPPTYLHMLGFPLSVQLMTREDFPFGLMGMVHVANRITQHRPAGIDETLELTASVTNLRPHPKGQQMDNVVVATAGGVPVWESTSTYLKRGSGADEAASGSNVDVEVATLPLTGLWRVPGDIGRRYGAVSGDRNPIHMSGLTAKAFGFPKAIAHGMWTKARALAGLEGGITAGCEIDVAFKLPLLLPRTVEYATQRTDGGGWAFGVRSRDGKPHLAGTVTPRA